MEEIIYIDGHIHLYDNFSIVSFFENTEKNFNKYQTVSKSQRILIFTEGKTNDYFSSFRDDSKILNKYGYSIEYTSEKNSLLIKKNGAKICYLIQGRQIVTAENIEILSIGAGNIIKDGIPSEEVINQLIKLKKPAVLAWGFGKWFFKRGRLVKNLVKKFSSPYLLLGDNSARPVFWPYPKIFKMARRKNYKIINGSDPLPLFNEEKKAASYGFIIEGKFDKNKPSASVVKLLIDEKTKIKFFGKRDGIISFISRQLKMFTKKHL